MEFKTPTPIGKMAVVTDEENERTEVVRIDTLRLLLFGINYCPRGAIGPDQGSLQISFAWGGYDSRGVFHADPRRPAANRSLSADVEHERELWRDCVFDSNGNPIANGFDTGFFRKLLVELELINKPFIEWIVEGGWNFTDIELFDDDVCVMKRKDGKRVKVQRPERPERRNVH
jgi:hypothetical protein